MNLIIDKSKWKKVSLREVVTKQEENDRENAHSRFDRFLKVAHMDAGSLHIKRWASQAAGDDINPTFYKIFRKGQILFPTRNPHLRRTALASFDGICGEKTLTLQPNEELIDPEFLPFLFHSESFYAHTTASIIGSTNPHCRWRDVANYEFLLPPKEQQAELAELLWAMDEVAERENKVLKNLNQAYEVENNKNFSSFPGGWECVPLKNIASINKQSLKAKTNPDYTFRYLDIASIVAPKKLGQLSTLTYESSPSRARRIVSNNSIVLSLVRPYQQSFVFVDFAQDIIASTGTGVIDINKDIDPRFVYHQFFSLRFLRFCENRMTGTNYPAITPKDLAQFKIAMPPTMEEVSVILQKLDSLDDSIVAVESKCASSKTLQKSLINQVF